MGWNLKAWFKGGWHALSTRRACGRPQHALRVLRACHPKMAFLEPGRHDSFPRGISLPPTVVGLKPTDGCPWGCCPSLIPNPGAPLKWVSRIAFQDPDMKSETNVRSHLNFPC